MKKLFSLGVAAFVFISCSTTKNLHSKQFLQTQKELTDKLTEINKTASFNVLRSRSGTL